MEANTTPEMRSDLDLHGIILLLGVVPIAVAVAAATAAKELEHDGGNRGGPVAQPKSMRSLQHSTNGTSFEPTSSLTADVVH